MKPSALKRTFVQGTIAAAIGIVIALSGCIQADSADNGSSSPDSTSSDIAATRGGGNMEQADGGFGALIKAYYSRSGDSLGNLYYIETDIDDDGTPIVRVAESPRHDVRAEIAEYRMPDDLLERISAIADEAGIKTWGDLPMGDLIPLDAATPTVTLTYESADPDDPFPVRLSFTAWDEFPEGGEEAFEAIRNELTASLIPENQIRTYIEPERD